MKAKLEFNLDNVDDNIAHYRCVKSLDMAITLFDIIYNLKKRCYNKCNDNEEMCKGIDIVFDSIFELIDDNGININELVI